MIRFLSGYVMIFVMICLCQIDAQNYYGLVTFGTDMALHRGESRALFNCSAEPDVSFECNATHFKVINCTTGNVDEAYPRNSPIDLGDELGFVECYETEAVVDAWFMSFEQAYVKNVQFSEIGCDLSNSVGTIYYGIDTCFDGGFFTITTDATGPVVNEVQCSDSCDCTTACTCTVDNTNQIPVPGDIACYDDRSYQIVTPTPVTDPCDGFTCPAGTGPCVAVRDIATCPCPAGTTRDFQTQQCVDPPTPGTTALGACAANACNPGFVCRNNVCVCAPGLVFSNGNCVPRPRLSAKICRAQSDPHFSSFGNVNFDYYGVGEYVLMRSTTPEIEIQVRLDYIIGSTSGPSVVSELAVKAEGKIVRRKLADIGQIEVDGTMEMLNSFPLVGATREKSFFNGDITISGNDQDLQIDFRSGLSITASIEPTLWKSITIVLPDNFQGTTSGLCSSNQNGKENVLVHRDNTETTPTWEIPVSFGDSWTLGSDARILSGTKKRYENLSSRKRQAVTLGDACGTNYETAAELCSPLLQTSCGNVTVFDQSNEVLNCIYDYCITLSPAVPAAYTKEIRFLCAQVEKQNLVLPETAQPSPDSSDADLSTDSEANSDADSEPGPATSTSSLLTITIIALLSTIL